MSKVQSQSVVVYVLLFFGMLFSTGAIAKLRVFACEPEWAALVSDLGGNRVRVRSATSPFQDPHRIEARPSLIARLRRADLLVCTGAGLEQSWLPLVLRRASNGKVLPGQPGHFLAADHVQLIGQPARLDRSLGDIHASGNPHIHTSPKNILTIARALSQRLARVDQRSAGYYRDRLNAFSRRWNARMIQWRSVIKKLKGKRIISQHKTWEYLLHWAEIKLVTTIEDKPGVAPSLQRLQQVLQMSKDNKVQLIVYASHVNAKSARWLSQRSGIPAAELPYTVGSHKQTETLDSWFDSLVKKLGGQ